ncbi:hypothetical protein ACF0H5_012273 [Mactra antiquata]
MDSVNDVTNLCKSITLLDAISWIVKAWDSVKTETIRKCFSLVGFNYNDVELNNDDDDTDVDDDDDVPLAVLVRELRYTNEEIDNLDNGIETKDHSENWEEGLIDGYRQRNEIESFF